MSRISAWDDVVAKLSSRLSRWKLKTLSIGRLTLIKYMLSSLPLYYMSSFKVPKGVLSKMESIRRNFFNGVENAEKKMYLISWNKFLATKQNGGLGFSSFFASKQNGVLGVSSFFSMITAVFTFVADPGFLENDIRVKPNLDALVALRDARWYSGVIMSCGAALQWEDGKVATFHCSFLANRTMSITASGTKGSLHIDDYAIPFEEKQCSFSTLTESGFTELVTGRVPLPSQHTIMTNLPQEALRLKGVRGGKPTSTSTPHQFSPSSH
ncbi:hypothetical protein Tco_1530945 [Tanacetum coccineum]